MTTLYVKSRKIEGRPGNFSLSLYNTDDDPRVWKEIFPCVPRGMVEERVAVLNEILWVLWPHEEHASTAASSSVLQEALWNALSADEDDDWSILVLLLFGAVASAGSSWFEDVFPEQLFAGLNANRAYLYGRNNAEAVINGFPEYGPHSVPPYVSDGAADEDEEADGDGGGGPDGFSPSWGPSGL